MAKKEIRLYLIRHAQTPYNADDIYIGGRSNHLPLTSIGDLQSIAIGERLKKEGIVFDKMWASTALRSNKTASKICEIIGYPLEKLILSDELLEKNQGDWEGKVRSEYYTPEVIKMMAETDGHFSPPKGESPRQVEERMRLFMNKNILPNPGTYAVNSHGYAIKAFLTGILNSSYSMTHRIHLDNTSITELTYDGKNWDICRINDNAHLLNI